MLLTKGRGIRKTKAPIALPPPLLPPENVVRGSSLFHYTATYTASYTASLGDGDACTSTTRNSAFRFARMFIGDIE